MKKKLFMGIIGGTLLASCNSPKNESKADSFNYTVEQFADLQLLRYQVPGFEELPLQTKELIYYLSEAALQGRDILFDQNGKYNLIIRRLLEAVYTEYKGNRNDANFLQLETYLKRVWFANGIHHHYGCDKFEPQFSAEFFRTALEQIDASKLPLSEGETLE
ncbi:MAG: dipeptidyl-peptidase 3 family protein, partial [Phocaeicola sp.]